MSELTVTERQALDELKEAVVSLVGDRLKAFVLFGSKARGDFDVESDLDVAILIDGLDKDTKRKIFDAAAEIELRHLVVLATLVLSWADFQDLKGRERRIALDIEEEGIPL